MQVKKSKMPVTGLAAESTSGAMIDWGKTAIEP
jgi:hypothetical protein